MNVFEILFFETGLDKKKEIRDLTESNIELYNYFCLLQELYSSTKHAGVILCEINDPNITDHFVFYNKVRKYIGLVIMGKSKQSKIEYFFSTKHASWFHYIGPDTIELPEHKQIRALQDNKKMKFSEHFKYVFSESVPVFLMGKEVFTNQRDLEDRMSRFCKDLKKNPVIRRLQITDILTKSMYDCYRDHKDLFTCHALKFILGVNYKTINTVIESQKKSKYRIISQIINVQQCKKYNVNTKALDYTTQIEYVPTALYNEVRTLFRSLKEKPTITTTSIGSKYENIDAQAAKVEATTDELQVKISTIDKNVTKQIEDLIVEITQRVDALKTDIDDGKKEFETYLQSRIFLDTIIPDTIQNVNIRDPDVQNAILLDDFYYYNTEVPKIARQIPVLYGTRGKDSLDSEYVLGDKPVKFEYEFYIMFGNRWLLAIDQDMFNATIKSLEPEKMLHFQQTVMPPMVWFNNQKRYIGQSNFIKSFANFIYNFFKLNTSAINEWAELRYFNFDKNPFCYFMWQEVEKTTIDDILKQFKDHNEHSEKLLKYETEIKEAVSSANTLMQRDYFVKFKGQLISHLTTLGIVEDVFVNAINYQELIRIIFMYKNDRRVYADKLHQIFTNFRTKNEDDLTKVLNIIGLLMFGLLKKNVFITSEKTIQQASYGMHMIEQGLVVKNMSRLIDTIFILPDDSLLQFSFKENPFLTLNNRIAEWLYISQVYTYAKIMKGFNNTTDNFFNKTLKFHDNETFIDKSSAWFKENDENFEELKGKFEENNTISVVISQMLSKIFIGFIPTNDEDIFRILYSVHEFALSIYENHAKLIQSDDEDTNKYATDYFITSYLTIAHTLFLYIFGFNFKIRNFEMNKLRYKLIVVSQLVNYYLHFNHYNTNDDLTYDEMREQANIILTQSLKEHPRTLIFDRYANNMVTEEEKVIFKNLIANDDGASKGFTPPDEALSANNLRRSVVVSLPTITFKKYEQHNTSFFSFLYNMLLASNVYMEGTDGSRMIELSTIQKEVGIFFRKFSVALISIENSELNIDYINVMKYGIILNDNSFKSIIDNFENFHKSVLKDLNQLENISVERMNDLQTEASNNIEYDNDRIFFNILCDVFIGNYHSKDEIEHRYRCFGPILAMVEHARVIFRFKKSPVVLESTAMYDIAQVMNNYDAIIFTETERRQINWLRVVEVTFVEKTNDDNSEIEVDYDNLYFILSVLSWFDYREIDVSNKEMFIEEYVSEFKNNEDALDIIFNLFNKLFEIFRVESIFDFIDKLWKNTRFRFNSLSEDSTLKKIASFENEHAIMVGSLKNEKQLLALYMTIVDAIRMVKIGEFYLNYEESILAEEQKTINPRNYDTLIRYLNSFIRANNLNSDEKKTLIIYYHRILKGKSFMSAGEANVPLECLFKPQLFKFLDYK